jgi:hypothetical protein
VALFGWSTWTNVIWSGGQSSLSSASDQTQRRQLNAP